MELYANAMYFIVQLPWLEGPWLESILAYQWLLLQPLLFVIKP